MFGLRLRQSAASPEHCDSAGGGTRGQGPLGCAGAGGGGAGGAGGGGDGRLNLLLSCASWRDDTWADRLPHLLQPMGVSAVRATTARHAERVIRSTPIHIAVVDLGLPLDEAEAAASDEAGTRVLDLLARLSEPVPTVVVQSPRTQRDGRRALAAALNCGVYAVVDRSAADLEFMLGIMRRCLDRFYGSRWPTRADVV